MSDKNKKIALAFDQLSQAANAMLDGFDMALANHTPSNPFNTNMVRVLMENFRRAYDEADIVIMEAIKCPCSGSEKTLVVDFGLDGDEQSVGSSLSDIPEAYHNEIPAFLLKAGGTD